MIRLFLLIATIVFFIIPFCVENPKECHTITSKGTDLVALSLDNQDQIPVDKEEYEKYKVGDQYCIVHYTKTFIISIVIGSLCLIILLISIGGGEVAVELLGAIVEGIT
jgi:hypothetical protein